MNRRVGHQNCGDRVGFLYWVVVLLLSSHGTFDSVNECIFNHKHNAEYTNVDLLYIFDLNRIQFNSQNELHCLFLYACLLNHSAVLQTELRLPILLSHPVSLHYNKRADIVHGV